jgi:preprotein translocase subunit YajC
MVPPTWPQAAPPPAFLITQDPPMFIATAYAAANAANNASGGGMATLINFAPIILIVVVFYFILIRPQQQQQKTLRNQLSLIKRGDRVVTGGGIIGIVQKAADGATEIEVEIAPNVRVNVLRSTITTVLSGSDAKPATVVKVAEVKKPAK